MDNNVPVTFTNSKNVPFIINENPACTVGEKEKNTREISSFLQKLVR